LGGSVSNITLSVAVTSDVIGSVVIVCDHGT